MKERRGRERLKGRVCWSNLLFTPAPLLWLGAKKRPLLIIISSTQIHADHWRGCECVLLTVQDIQMCDCSNSTIECALMGGTFHGVLKNRFCDKHVNKLHHNRYIRGGFFNICQRTTDTSLQQCRLQPEQSAALSQNTQRTETGCR